MAIVASRMSRSVQFSNVEIDGAPKGPGTLTILYEPDGTRKIFVQAQHREVKFTVAPRGRVNLVYYRLVNTDPTNGQEIVTNSYIGSVRTSTNETQAFKLDFSPIGIQAKDPDYLEKELRKL